MKRDIAERLMEAIKGLHKAFNDVHLVLEDVVHDPEMRPLRRGLAEVVADTHEKITHEVLKHYPDLNPYK